jgi:predicted DNA-binding ribbon-helix-helix protein
VRKRSISIKGHRTSVRLEPEFWAALERAAKARRLTLPALVAELDEARMKKSPPAGLASALRVFALVFAGRSGVGDKAD